MPPVGDLFLSCTALISCELCWMDAAFSRIGGGFGNKGNASDVDHVFSICTLYDIGA